jgi:hypothetical protein
MWRSYVVFCKFTYVLEKRAQALFNLAREEKFIFNFGKFSQVTNCEAPAGRHSA